jgi:hypothetical protein
VALHSRCTQLASFDGRMQQAATALGLSPALASARVGWARRVMAH